MSQCDRTGRRCAADNLGCDEPECAYGSRSHVSGTAPEREARDPAVVGGERDGRKAAGQQEPPLAGVQKAYAHWRDKVLPETQETGWSWSHMKFLAFVGGWNAHRVAHPAPATATPAPLHEDCTQFGCQLRADASPPTGGAAPPRTDGAATVGSTPGPHHSASDGSGGS